MTEKVNNHVGERGLAGVISWSRQEQMAGWILIEMWTVHLGQDFSTTALGTFRTGRALPRRPVVCPAGSHHIPGLYPQTPKAHQPLHPRWDNQKYLQMLPNGPQDLPLPGDILGAHNWGEECRGHQVGRGQGRCEASFHAQNDPHDQELLSPKCQNSC